MDERKLRYFAAVVENSSFTKAAQAVNISQPALTKAIGLLERELDVQLFDRGHSAATPTKYGRALYNRAKAVMAEFDTAVAEIDNLKREKVAPLAVAALASATKVVAVAARNFCAKNVDHPIRIVEMINPTLVEALRRGELDMAVGMHVAGLPFDGLICIPLLTDKLSVIAKEGHPVHGRNGDTLSATLEFPWVLPPVGESSRVALEQLFLAQGLKAPLPQMQTSSMSVTRFVVAESNFIGLMPYSGRHPPAIPGISVLPIVSDFLSRHLQIIRRENHPLTKSGMEFVEELRNACRYASE